MTDYQCADLPMAECQRTKSSMTILPDLRLHFLLGVFFLLFLLPDLSLFW